MQKSTYAHTLTQKCEIEEKNQFIAIRSGFTGRFYKKLFIKQHCQQVNLMLSICSTKEAML